MMGVFDAPSPHAVPTDVRPDASLDALGLTGTFPRPGWVVLDAIRDLRFTGEVVVTSSPEARVYADRGRIYLAERLGDAALGSRLVAGGALTAEQLDQGALRIGDVEHLGRLFDRVASLNRDAVLITTEMITDECLSWLAGERVHDAVATPYRRHPSGIHRWERVVDAARASSPAPAGVAPLPPPPPPSPSVVAPAALAPPPVPAPPFAVPTGGSIVMPPPGASPSDAAHVDAARDNAADVVIRWDDLLDPGERPARSNSFGDRTTDWPSVGVVDGAPDETFASAEPARPSVAAAPSNTFDLSLGGDWVDRLEAVGELPEHGSEMLISPVRLPQIPVEPTDRFEVIWPSGEVDEQFGVALAAPPINPDLDRSGPTARMVRDGVSRLFGQTTASPVAPQPDDIEVSMVDDDLDSPGGLDTIDLELDYAGLFAGDPEPEPVSDEVVLAVREAVASIESGSLVTRPRPIDVTSPRSLDPSRTAVQPPVRAAANPIRRAPTTSSVFDVAPPTHDADIATGEVNAQHLAGADAAASEADRSSALRRLVGSLRRR